MLLRIPSVLTTAQLDTVRLLLADARFVDGKLSAGMAARRVKHNEELDKNAKQLEILNNLVMSSLVQHPVYRAGAGEGAEIIALAIARAAVLGNHRRA